MNKIKRFFANAGKKLFTTARAKVWWLIILILAITVLAGFLDYPKYYDQGVNWLRKTTGIALPEFYKLPFRLGLDLQGGTHLIYEADTSAIPDKDRDDALEGARDVIERRVNAFGVAEPVVQTTSAGDSQRIIVELAGIKDVSEAIKMIGETPLLEFKEQNPDIGTAQILTDEQKKEMNDYNSTAKKTANEALKKARAKGADFATLVEEYSTDEATKSVGGDLGFITKDGVYADWYDDAAKLKVGGVSGLIETDEYIGIIKLVAVQDSKEVKANHLLICWEGAQSCTGNLSKEDAKKKIDELKTEATAANFIDLVKANSSEPGASESGGDLGWFGKDMMVKPFEEATFAMKVGEISDVIETQFGYHLIYKTDERAVKEYRVSRILIDKKTSSEVVPPSEEWIYTGLTGKQLVRAQVQFDPNTSAPQVGLEFNDEGKELFGEITERNVGKLVAIFLDGEPISVPTVQEPIKDGSAIISGSFTIPEAKILAQRLNAGALPVPINLISQETIGAALGQESVTKSLIAGLIGFLAVIVFMILYYRLPGFLSALSLIFYAVLVLALFKLIPVTLTLAGIAGFVLSVGMAVDANVLIFERMKEELRLGKPLGSAINEGFIRAWPSIRDGNITTLISCFVLFWFSTSMIKGFALTLSVGVIMSLFSAIFITRSFLNFIAPWFHGTWIFGVKKK
ncbi:MAG: protein translocase subunit SecD [Patescibacteria group bacterium]